MVMEKHRTWSGRKYHVRHVGEGRTNPEQRGRMLALMEYLHHGFQPQPPDNHDEQLRIKEVEAEAQVKQSFINDGIME